MLPESVAATVIAVVSVKTIDDVATAERVPTLGVGGVVGKPEVEMIDVGLASPVDEIDVDAASLFSAVDVGIDADAVNVISAEALDVIVAIEPVALRDKREVVDEDADNDSALLLDADSDRTEDAVEVRELVDDAVDNNDAMPDGDTSVLREADDDRDMAAVSEKSEVTVPHGDGVSDIIAEGED